MRHQHPGSLWLPAAPWGTGNSCNAQASVQASSMGGPIVRGPNTLAASSGALTYPSLCLGTSADPAPLHPSQPFSHSCCPGPRRCQVLPDWRHNDECGCPRSLAPLLAGALAEPASPGMRPPWPLAVRPFYRSSSSAQPGIPQVTWHLPVRPGRMERKPLGRHGLGVTFLWPHVSPSLSQHKRAFPPALASRHPRNLP